MARSQGNSGETFEPWSIKKTGILSKYTTSEKLSIMTSFLSGGEKGEFLFYFAREFVLIMESNKMCLFLFVPVVIKTHSSVADKVKTRLEQLDDFEEGSIKEMLNLTQQEYVHRIEELNQALIEAWEVDQRVRALKIAIQVSS